MVGPWDALFPEQIRPWTSAWLGHERMFKNQLVFKSAVFVFKNTAKSSTHGSPV